MKGCRPLSDTEISQVLVYLSNPRDKALFILGIRTGFRISELCSLKVSDVMGHDQILSHVTVQRRHTKGQLESRSIVLHKEAKAVLELLIGSYDLKSSSYLFEGREGPLSRHQAWRILKEAYQAARLNGKLATHSMRKTYASKMYQALGKDLVKTQRAMGHKNINSTISYLSFAEEEIDNAILGVK